MSKEFADLIEHGVEERNLEYKGAVAWNEKEFMGKLCKTIMAMSNLRDGGAIVIGVEEQPKGTWTPTGISTADADTFNQDDMADFVNGYSSPSAQFAVRKFEHEEHLYVIIEVRQFAEIPIVCRKTGPAKLRPGALYTRSFKKVETAEVSSEEEMREILQMAGDRAAKAFYERAQAVGIMPVDESAATEMFDAQIGDL